MGNQICTESDEISKEALVEFFRKIINDDWGYTEVMEASPESVLTKYITPQLSKNHVVPKFLQSRIFDESICSVLDRYTIKVDDRHRVDRGEGEFSQLYDNLDRFFNPDLVYNHFDGYEDEGSNLLVLKRDSLSEDQKRGLIQRGESWLNVLYDVEKETEGFWGWGLPNTIESLVAKVNPQIEREFLYQGKVIGFSKQDSEEYPTVGAVGMIVDGFDNHPCSNGSLIPLVNASDQNRFGNLVGQNVKYHFLEIIRSIVGFPYGELILINKKVE